MITIPMSVNIDNETVSFGLDSDSVELSASVSADYIVSTDYADLANKPGINGTELVGSLTSGDIGVASAEHTHTKSEITDFSHTHVKSEITDFAHGHYKSDILDFPSLATVATSGSYEDLADTPDIPTVNDATLTIKKNGTTVETFSANAASDVTADIIVPVKLSDMTNDLKVSDFTNDAGYLASYTETDPVFAESAAHGISSSDITAWNGKSVVTVTQKTSSGENIADITIDGTTTKLYAPEGSSGAVSDVEVDGVSVVSSGVASIDLTGKVDVSSLATVATSGDYDDLTNKPTIPTVPTNVSDFNNDAGYITSDDDTTYTISKSGDVITLTGSDTSTSTVNATTKFYGVCSTAKGTAAKTVSIPAVTELSDGLTIQVKFNASNTASDPTLQVNSLTAKPIYRYGTTAAGTSAASSWNAGEVVTLTYDGTGWQMVDFNNTTYTSMTVAEYEAGTGTTARIITPARLKAAILYHAPANSIADVQVDGTSVVDNNGIAEIDLTGKADASHTHTVSDVTDFPTIPSKTSDLTNDSNFITGMYIASYGSSSYADVLAAYQAGKVVYCRASSNSNPGTGNKLRMAFLAYVNSETTPTEFEFQYYRSVSTHSDSQQGDQVYVYKLNSSGTWSVTTREAYTKISAGTGLSSSYSNGTLTLTASATALTNQEIDDAVDAAWA